MFFTDAYSTLNEEGLYKMVMTMKKSKNQDVVCCTGRARVYTIEQELDLQNLLREDYDYKEETEESETDYGLQTEDDDEKKALDTESEQEKDNDDDDDNNDNQEMDGETNKRWWDNDIFFNDADDKDNKSKTKIDIMSSGDDNGEDDVFYNIQDLESDHRLTMNAHLRSCQMFEFEALYGTIGSYLLGSFLPVIPGPCGFYRSEYLLLDQVRGWYFEKRCDV